VAVVRVEAIDEIPTVVFTWAEQGDRFQEVSITESDLHAAVGDCANLKVEAGRSSDDFTASFSVHDVCFGVDGPRLLPIPLLSPLNALSS